MASNGCRNNLAEKELESSSDGHGIKLELSPHGSRLELAEKTSSWSSESESISANVKEESDEGGKRTFLQLWWPDAHCKSIKWYKDLRFWIGVSLVMIFGSLSPLFQKRATLEVVYGCPRDEDGNYPCEAELFVGFLSCGVFKYMSAMVIAGLGYKWDRSRIKRKKNPQLSMIKNYDTPYFGGGVVKVLGGAIVGSIFDATFTVLSRASIVYTRPSMAAIMTSLCIPTGALLQHILLREGITRYEWFSLIIVLTSMTIQCYDSVMGGQEGEDLNTKLGVMLATVSGVCRGAHLVTQARVFRNYTIAPLKLQFIESFFSLGLMFVWAIPIHYGGVMDVYKEFWGTMNSSWAFWGSFINGFGSAFFNLGSTIVGIIVTTTFRIIIMNVQGVISWFLELAIGWSNFTFMVFLANTLMVIGTFSYGGLLTPIKYTRWFWRPVTFWGWVNAPQHSVAKAPIVTESEGQGVLSCQSYTTHL